MSRADYLSTLGYAKHFDPCRCEGTIPGWKFNNERNMWTCSNCSKPNASHERYNVFCSECGTKFTYKVYVEEKLHWCPECE